MARATLFILLWLFFAFSPFNSIAGEIERGKYIFDLAGCVGCHTDKKSNGPILGGGRKFETQFGTFYSPNITTDINNGIGKWTFADFSRAMRNGVSPAGQNYYPAFPYTSYNKITDDDLKALWVYLQSVPPVAQKNISHDLRPPFNWRFLISIWKLINFDKTPFAAEPEKPDTWKRGRYIVEALSHCRECHTPRNIIGGMDMTMDYAGTDKNPEGITVPNITPERETGIGKWTKDDLDMLLKIGMLPNADFVGGVMAESISHSTSKMTPGDRGAVIEYLGEIRPIVNSVRRKKSDNSGESWQ